MIKELYIIITYTNNTKAQLFPKYCHTSILPPPFFPTFLYPLQKKIYDLDFPTDKTQ